MFQSTHPLRGATLYIGGVTLLFTFQSTHPLRGATFVAYFAALCLLFQSTHPLRGATVCPTLQTTCILVSIHAPLARCDVRSSTLLCKDGCFNPRTPCEVRLTTVYKTQEMKLFQSTHPLRGATFVEMSM